MAPGVEGAAALTVIEREDAALELQTPLATTVMFPEPVPTVTVIEVPPCPELMAHPDGTPHV